MKVKLDLHGYRQFKGDLKKFAKAIGTDVRGALIAKAVQTGNKLAAVTEPFGLKNDKAKKIAEGAIAGDVHKVFLLHAHTLKLLKDKSPKLAGAYHAAVIENRIQDAEDLARKFLNRNIITGGDNALQSQRGKRGRVKSGNDSVLTRDKSHLQGYKDKLLKDAGLSKGAWYAAVADIRETKARPPIKWLRKDPRSGTGTIKGNEWQTEITLINNIPYASNNLTASKAAKAMDQDLKAFKKRMDKTILSYNQKS